MTITLQDHIDLKDGDRCEVFAWPEGKALPDVERTLKQGTIVDKKAGPGLVNVVYDDGERATINQGDVCPIGWHAQCTGQSDVR
jgi:hypothetical protein